MEPTQCHARPFALALSRLIVSLALLLVNAPFCTSDPASTPPISTSPIPWDANTQGRFVTCSTKDTHGNTWIGGEDGQGLWVYIPAIHLWQHHTPHKELPGDIYALACDRLGRIWAGSLNQGVSVWNGQVWRKYSVASGPIGSRVYAIACCPSDGDVWVATEAGLSRYSFSRNLWFYYTRLEGLPADQATSLAFDKHGDLYVGTACNGIAIGRPENQYQTWTTVIGPASLPNTSGGDGLPSNLINSVLVSKEGTIYVGATAGLARSEDGGKKWRYLRGADWEEKNNQRMNAPKPRPLNTLGHIMLEDYVTCLAEDSEGRLYVGYRQKGFEVVDPETGKRLYPDDHTATDEYVSTLLPLGGGDILIGGYGSGLREVLCLGKAAPLSDMTQFVHDSLPMPAPAKPLSAAALYAMLRQVRALKIGFPQRRAIYLGEDWQTQGDWVERYGKQYALLCATATPLDQHLSWTADYSIQGEMGPHHNPGDSLRRWVHWEHTDNPKSLYSPVNGYRTQAEWDDHGEAYPLGVYGGPDVWSTITLPAGVHRISLYDMNKDGHDGDNRYRDYLVDVLPYTAKMEDAEKQPSLAHARIRNFWGGVYEQFVVSGPGKYYIRISKNNSLNTILAGLFIDKLAGPKLKTDSYPVPFTDGDYQPPDLDAPPDKTRTKQVVLNQSQQIVIQAARSLWSALDAARNSPGSYQLQYLYRLYAYRAVVDAGGPDSLVHNWQWHLHIWTQWDHDTFNHYMESSAESILRTPNITRSK